MKIAFAASLCFGLLTCTWADESEFRVLEQQSRTLQLKTLGASSNGCTLENAAVRREWGSLPATDKKAYISAVKCLRQKPSLTYPLVPGARSHYDDFQAVHINQTFLIHFNAVFLPWHRYFTWAYEKALREECGYEGYQPYWEWSAFANDPTASPLFDGSETSISGNGEKIPHEIFSYIIPRSNTTITGPPQDGGGCLWSGPFANLTVNLGPVNSAGSLPGFIGNGTGFEYNPRCLVRDMGTLWSSYLSWENVTGLINQTTFAHFESTLSEGIHGPGHFMIGGLNYDLFTGVGDPAFFFHHAQVDRIWTLWQNLDIETRGRQLEGPVNWFNSPPGPNITLDFPMDLGVIAPQREAGTLMSTLEGDFCYRYE